MIREADPADLPRLRGLQRTALAAPQPELLALGARGNGATLLVSTAAGAVRGYALAVAGDGAPAYLAEVAVAPTARREGHGSALVAALAERLAAAELRLTARADDEASLSFYRSVGFERVRRLPDHYAIDGDRVDGLLLRRRL